MLNLFGIPEAVVLLWTSAFFYFITILFIWNPVKEEKSELKTAFLAFLFGMAFFHTFLGLGFYLNNLLIIHIGAFAALTGSAFTFKFPLSLLKEETWRQLGFYIALLAAWSILVWMIIFSHETQPMLTLILLYMIIVTGISGFSIIIKGMEAKENWMKVKCGGGGLGLIICCVFADLMVLLSGKVSLLGEVLMSVAPMFLLLSLLYGRYLQKKTTQSPSLI